jgi:hypothetical protein
MFLLFTYLFSCFEVYNQMIKKKYAAKEMEGKKQAYLVADSSILWL